eukprot:CAMPEP_0195648246 /NCGR_PEP_ID=MMETSP0815-20121206/30533_1 /TAXON_ID=97485 /ORGANISM="Prymnesium parvum, Strain Texoma1" /LENGTH=31 /DNA_ID= /DNA_START= /DNA_END= /DNA_ORIENTATION=
MVQTDGMRPCSAIAACPVPPSQMQTGTPRRA